MDKAEANAKIAELVANAKALIGQATNIAREAEVDFSLNLGYGMGGTYVGDREEWGESRYEEIHDYYGGWYSSSMDC